MTTTRRSAAWGPLAVMVAVSVPVAAALAYAQQASGVSTEVIRFTQFASELGCVVAWLVWRGQWTRWV